jgi:hypothetical protein
MHGKMGCISNLRGIWLFCRARLKRVLITNKTSVAPKAKLIPSLYDWRGMIGDKQANLLEDETIIME